jgi:hypothetical protein
VGYHQAKDREARRRVVPPALRHQGQGRQGPGLHSGCVRQNSARDLRRRHARHRAGTPVQDPGVRVCGVHPVCRPPDHLRGDGVGEPRCRGRDASRHCRRGALRLRRRPGVPWALAADRRGGRRRAGRCLLWRPAVGAGRGAALHRVPPCEAARAGRTAGARRRRRRRRGVLGRAPAARPHRGGLCGCAVRVRARRWTAHGGGGPFRHRDRTVHGVSRGTAAPHAGGPCDGGWAHCARVLHGVVAGRSGRGGREGARGRSGRRGLQPGGAGGGTEPVQRKPHGGRGVGAPRELACGEGFPALASGRGCGDAVGICGALAHPRRPLYVCVFPRCVRRKWHSPAQVRSARLGLVADAGPPLPAVSLLSPPVPIPGAAFSGEVQHHQLRVCQGPVGVFLRCGQVGLPHHRQHQLLDLPGPVHGRGRWRLPGGEQLVSASG